MIGRFRRWVGRLVGSPPSDDTPPGKYFSWIYAHNAWGGTKSKSGEGSEGAFAAQKVSILKEILPEYHISTVLDLGCGDFFWMKDIVPLVSRYHGVDVVPEVVVQNQQQYGGPSVSFQCLDLSSHGDQTRLDFREPDLVICFDIFGHLLNK